MNRHRRGASVRRLTRLTIVLTVALSCAQAQRAGNGAATSVASKRTSVPASDTRASAVLTRAIAYAGGEQALTAAQALTWDGDAVVHVGGRDIAITGSWRIQPPDTAIVATYAVANGPSTMRSMIVAAPRGWTEAHGTFTPLTPSVLANERDEFYLYAVIRLVPLRAPGVRLLHLTSDSLGNEGIDIRSTGRPDVDAYFNKDGRMVWLRTTVVHPLTGAQAREDMSFVGSLKGGGIVWPRELHITLDGAPYFDLTMRNLGVAPRLGDAVLHGPR